MSMKTYQVVVKALILIDDPQIIDGLILSRIIKDEAGEETISSCDDEFQVIEYPDDWLDFEEIIDDDERN